MAGGIGLSCSSNLSPQELPYATGTAVKRKKRKRKKRKGKGKKSVCSCQCTSTHAFSSMERVSRIFIATAESTSLLSSLHPRPLFCLYHHLFHHQMAPDPSFRPRRLLKAWIKDQSMFLVLNDYYPTHDARTATPLSPSPLLLPPSSLCPIVK